MGKRDDSSDDAMGDLPTDDELFLMGEIEDDDDDDDDSAGDDDLDDSERTDPRDNTPRGENHGRKKRSSSSAKHRGRHQQQQQQRRRPNQPRRPGSSVTEITGVTTSSMSASYARGRWIVILVFCAGAAGMALTTFAYIARTEKEEFENAVRWH